ncbi:MAG: hypothetical protein QNK23_01595 [Crocinitomicaceae bacterium]|nr:hypothetical protein [Crocinitomicaceae bacterium]
MFRKIIASFLILVVLVGTVGVSYDSHFCGGELIKSQFSFLPHQLSCGMLEQTSNDCDEDAFSRVCCSNEHTSFQMDDDFVQYDAPVLAFVIDFKFPEIVFEVDFFELTTKYEFIGYSPPPTDEDIIILNQTFLI